MRLASEALMISTGVLITVNNGTWVAQATEFNLYAQADSLSNLSKEFTRICNLHSKDATSRGKEPFRSLNPVEDSIVSTFNSDNSVSIDFDMQEADNQSGVVVTSAKIYSL